MLPIGLLAALPLLAGVLAQDEGTLSGPTSSASAAGYSCDATKCKLPDCNCASTDPPGGLDPVSTSDPCSLSDAPTGACRIGPGRPHSVMAHVLTF